MGYDDETGRRKLKRGRKDKPGKTPGPSLITDSSEHRERRRMEDISFAPPEKKGRKKEQRTQRENPSDIYMDPAKRKKKKKGKRMVLLFAELLLLLAILLTGAYVYLTGRLEMIQRLPWDPEEIRNTSISEEKLQQMEGFWNIAVFGVDSRSDSVGKGNNADVNMICNINHDTGEVRLVSVYRDCYLSVDDRNSCHKINSAYLQGGPEQAVKALNRNLDLNISDYATFNWKAVADAINILGGVDVEITRSEFYYINAFISETVKATGVPSVQLEHAGMNHLDGVQAVAYGRLRLMDTDYARTERQRKIIGLAFEKAKKADWSTLNNIIQTVFPQIATSVDLSDLVSVGRNISRYYLSETTGFPTSRQEVHMGKKGACVIPDTLVSNVADLHSFLFGDTEYEPSETVKTISSRIAADVEKNRRPAPTKEPETKPEETEVPDVIPPGALLPSESPMESSGEEMTGPGTEENWYPGMPIPGESEAESEGTEGPGGETSESGEEETEPEEGMPEETETSGETGYEPGTEPLESEAPGTLPPEAVKPGPHEPGPHEPDPSEPVRKPQIPETGAGVIIIPD